MILKTVPKELMRGISIKIWNSLVKLGNSDSSSQIKKLEAIVIYSTVRIFRIR